LCSTPAIWKSTGAAAGLRTDRIDLKKLLRTLTAGR
jgi:hypothetical protein